MHTRSKLASKVWLNHLNEELQVKGGNGMLVVRFQWAKTVTSQTRAVHESRIGQSSSVNPWGDPAKPEALLQQYLLFISYFATQKKLLKGYVMHVNVHLLHVKIYECIRAYSKHYPSIFLVFRTQLTLTLHKKKTTKPDIIKSFIQPRRISDLYFGVY